LTFAVYRIPSILLLLHFLGTGKEALLRCAALDHDRDFAAFYNSMADMLE
jgi:hypothetical protein